MEKDNILFIMTMIIGIIMGLTINFGFGNIIMVLAITNRYLADIHYAIKNK